MNFANAFNLRTQETKLGRTELKACLVCIVSSKTARAKQRNPVLKIMESEKALVLRSLGIYYN